MYSSYGGSSWIRFFSARQPSGPFSVGGPHLNSTISLLSYLVCADQLTIVGHCCTTDPIYDDFECDLNLIVISHHRGYEPHRADRSGQHYATGLQMRIMANKCVKHQNHCTNNLGGLRDTWYSNAVPSQPEPRWDMFGFKQDYLAMWWADNYCLCGLQSRMSVRRLGQWDQSEWHHNHNVLLMIMALSSIDWSLSTAHWLPIITQQQSFVILWPTSKPLAMFFREERSFLTGYACLL